MAVTVSEPEVGLPLAIDLIPASRIAFRVLAKRDRHDFEVNNWTFTAHAVRAVTSQCLTCHQGRSIGDPLGVVLYAHQRQ